MTSIGKRGIARVTVLVLVCLAGVVAIALSPYPAATPVFMLGLVASATVAPLGQKRLSLLVVVLITVLNPVAALLSGTFAIAIAFIALMSVGLAFSSKFGLNNSLVNIPVYLVFTIMIPPDIAAGLGHVLDVVSFQDALILGAVMGAGALWGALLLPPAILTIQEPSSPTALPTIVAFSFGMVLVVSALLGAFIMLAWLPVSTGAWLMLTVYFVTMPGLRNTYIRSQHRVGGTVIGAILVSIVITFIPDPTAGFLIGSGFAVAALVAMGANLQYWIFVSFLTPAVVLLTSGGVDTGGRDLDRVLFTAIGVALVLMATLVGRYGSRLLIPKFQERLETEVRILAARSKSTEDSKGAG